MNKQEFLDDIEKIAETNQQIRTLEQQVRSSRSKIHKFFMDNGLWIPIQDLKDYAKDKEQIAAIMLVTLENKDSVPGIEYFCGEDILWCENGYFYASDYMNGIIEHVKGADIHTYRRYCNNVTQDLEILGFYDLCFMDENYDTKYVEGTEEQTLILEYLKEAEHVQ